VAGSSDTSSTARRPSMSAFRTRMAASITCRPARTRTRW
jgi:hypothetical protein